MSGFKRIYYNRLGSLDLAPAERATLTVAILLMKQVVLIQYLGDILYILPLAEL